MSKINFAVWNMCGTNARDHKFTKHREKINNLLDCKINGKEELDLVFFQEISDPELIFQKNPIGWNFEKQYKTVGQWRSCRRNHPEKEGACRGIVLYQRCDTDFEVTAENFSNHTNPIGVRYMIKKKSKKKPFLCFIGFWNIPEFDKNYQQHLENMLAAELPSFEIPCIIAGDTNVNLDSENCQKENTKEKCVIRRESLAKFLNGYGLTLLNHPGIFTHRQYEKDKETKKIIEESQSFFQCDLLMVSNTMLKDSEPPNIEPISLGHSVEHISKEFEKWGSDHLPLFFSYSYDDGSDNKV